MHQGVCNNANSIAGIVPHSLPITNPHSKIRSTPIIWMVINSAVVVGLLIFIVFANYVCKKYKQCLAK